MGHMLAPGVRAEGNAAIPAHFFEGFWHLAHVFIDV
jgi:hypothetical protein